MITLHCNNLKLEIAGKKKAKYSRHEIAQYIYYGKYLKKYYGKDWLLLFQPGGWIELKQGNLSL